MGAKDCLYPCPHSCSKFYQCTVNVDGVSGTPVERDCAPGTEWNDNDKQCDWPSQSTCKNGASTARPSTARPTTARPSTAQPSTAVPTTSNPDQSKFIKQG